MTEKMRFDLYKDLFEVENSHWWHKHKRKVVISFINKYVKVGEVLDIGAGTGKILSELKKIGWQVTGVDAANEALKWSKKRGINLHLVNIEKNKLPFKSNQFDLCLVLDFLEHIAEEKKSLEKIKRVTKSNGLIIFTVPAYQGLFSNWDKILGHKKRYSKSNLIKLIKSLNLKVEFISYYFTFALLPSVIIRKFKQASCENKMYVSDFQETLLPSVTIPILKVLSSIEQFLLQFLSLPFGLSIICIARKK